MTVPMKVRQRVAGAIVLGSDESHHRYTPADLAVAEELARGLSMALDNVRLYDEVQAAVRRREQFLAIAAHELKTPLTSLKLKLQTLLLDLGDDQPLDAARLRERVQGADRQTERLARLVDELLDVSSIVANRLRLHKQDLDLVAVVHTIVTQLGADAAARGVDVAVHTAAPVIGYWDRLRLEQVIVNLISNAIKYGNGRPVRITVAGDAAHARLSVEDEGIGMSREVMERLFRPFERGVATGEYAGLGLGLFITDQIVRAHGGTLQVRSQPGHGSVFTVELPRA
jgi:signal transduction histidine kinase